MLRPPWPDLFNLLSRNRFEIFMISYFTKVTRCAKQVLLL